jgi:hypothetical protein
MKGPKGSLLLSSLAAALASALTLTSCGGGSSEPKTPSNGAPNADEAKQATHACGDADKVQQHDLNGDKATEAFTPCAKAGASDYSGMIKIETIPEGVHIIINATDDEVNNGALGSDVKTRDAVIVYPKGKGSKAIEVPLVKTPTGYTGDKIVLYDDLDKLTDEGTKIDIAVFDHDKANGGSSEEMHVQVAVSTGKSCERAIDENPQTVDFGKKGGKADLTDEQLGAPMRSSSFFSGCGLSDSANADICVAVKKGRPLGVSVKVTPQNNKIAACIDRSTRRLHFPESEKLDVVHQKF